MIFVILLFSENEVLMERIEVLEGEALTLQCPQQDCNSLPPFLVTQCQQEQSKSVSIMTYLHHNLRCFWYFYSHPIGWMAIYDLGLVDNVGLWN